MKKIQTFEGEIKNGKLNLKHRGLFDLWCEALGDGEAVLTLGRTSKIRSVKANSYLWGWVYESIVNEIHKTTGISREDIHAMAKARAKKYVITKDNKVYEAVASTSSMTDEEFSKFVEGVKQWALEEFGVVVPPTINELMNQ